MSWMDVNQPSTVPAEHPLGPRERLESLILNRAAEQEILQVAQKCPEVFAYDIVETSPRHSTRCPLNHLVARRPIVSIETFEAVYDAFPTAIHSVDSFDNTVLSELLNNDHNDELFFELLKTAINKSNVELAVILRNNNTPIMKAIEKGCSQEVVQYMIDQHPGDPFREHTRNQRTLLSAVVKHSSQYSFEFLKNVFEQNRDAVRVQETDTGKSTVLHTACKGYPLREDVFRLILRAYPEGAFVRSRYGQLPLHTLMHPSLIGRDDVWEKDEILIQIALANPNAIFSATHDKDCRAFTPFSLLLSKKFLYEFGEEGCSWRTEPEASDYTNTWSFLFLFMHIYCHGDKTNVAEAWNPPQFPAHLAASCPCPSDFLILMAKLSPPDHLQRCDNEGRSVLSLALESGHCAGTRDYTDEGCIRRLVEIDIRMLGLLDAKTQLYPFMTAAYSQDSIVKMGILDCLYMGEQCEEDIRAEASLKCLNTIYFLLRADPSKAQRVGGHLPKTAPKRRLAELDYADETKRGSKRQVVCAEIVACGLQVCEHTASKAVYGKGTIGNG